MKCVFLRPACSTLKRARRITAHVVNMKQKIQSHPAWLKHGEVDDHRGREAERDRVDQRVEFLAEPAPAVGGARHAPVERVGDAAEDDVRDGAREVAARGGDDREDAEEQIGEREAVGQQDDARVARGARATRHAPSELARAAVVPANVVCPTFTCTGVPGGRKTSTREPKRMIPMRSPWLTVSPSRL